MLGALCGLIGERSGIINIGIEGQMLMAAFTSFMIAFKHRQPDPWRSRGAGNRRTLGPAAAFMSITLKVDQIIGGTVLNILAVGLTGYFYQVGAVSGGKFSPIPLGPLQISLDR